MLFDNNYVGSCEKTNFNINGYSIVGCGSGEYDSYN